MRIFRPELWQAAGAGERGKDGVRIKLWQTVGEETLESVLDFLWRDNEHQGKPVGRKIYAGSDSVLEVPEWYAFCEAPRSVAMQMETHKKKHGCYLWMTSARPDRDARAAEEYSRRQTVRFVFKFTARGIIDISHYRLCRKAEAPTIRFMWAMMDALKQYNGEGEKIASQMMPMCAFRNGLCTETNSCGMPWRYPSRNAEGQAEKAIEYKELKEDEAIEYKELKEDEAIKGKN